MSDRDETQPLADFNYWQPIAMQQLRCDSFANFVYVKAEFMIEHMEINLRLPI